MLTRSLALYSHSGAPQIRFKDAHLWLATSAASHRFSANINLTPRVNLVYPSLLSSCSNASIYWNTLFKGPAIATWLFLQLHRALHSVYPGSVSSRFPFRLRCVDFQQSRDVVPYIRFRFKTYLPLQHVALVCLRVLVFPARAGSMDCIRFAASFSPLIRRSLTDGFTGILSCSTDSSPSNLFGLTSFPYLDPHLALLRRVDLERSRDTYSTLEH
ncbi:hypothetical protein C8R47DRAFT_1139553 [Mycena vitilis]|nr:hypothetical protein C8R47DRAFT_1139553 [Mycena vitilis]